jgi:hypothetical protein
MVTHPKNIERERTVPEVYAEGLRYFMGEGTINKTLARLANDLEQRGIDYMVIGAIALLAHGYPRFTENIDLVMTSEGRQRFNDELKRLRSTIDGVSIEVMTTGEFPGDGKPKPVSMPRPNEASVEIDGIRFVTLEKLIELKLASGMSAPDRLKDLADVQELIKLKHLDADFALKLDPYVRPKYLELEAAVRRNNEHTE